MHLDVRADEMIQPFYDRHDRGTSSYFSALNSSPFTDLPVKRELSQKRNAGRETVFAGYAIILFMV
jgi:hypothetical protein